MHREEGNSRHRSPPLAALPDNSTGLTLSTSRTQSGALAEAIRRGVLEELRRGDASITELADVMDWLHRFQAPAELVFEAWSNPELLRRWWVLSVIRNDAQHL